MMHKFSTPSFAFLTLILIAWVQPVHADDDDFQRLARARSLRCTFGPGAVGDWRAGTVKLVNDRYDATVQFDSINVKSGSARVIGNIGAGDIAVLLTRVGLTFMDTRETFETVTITTVFGRKAKSGDYIAVTSRHFAALVPTPSQYHGTCQIWE